MITSPSNTQVKAIRSLLANRRERERQGCFVLEGVRLVSEALDAGASLRLTLYDPEHLGTTTAGQQLLQRLGEQPDCFAATPRALNVATDTVTPQGVVAVVAIPLLPPREGLVLVLDEVQDPGNVGTLLRSAEAVGVGVVLCRRGTADVYSPKVVRSAMGAHFYVPVRAALAWEEIAAMLAGVPRIYAAIADGDTPYDAAQWRPPVALLVGNESQGVSAAGLALATDTIAIPMVGRVASLNAAVAGSVLLFETLRQTSRQ